MSCDFEKLVRAHLVEVDHETEEEADRLIAEYKDVMINGILSGNIAATAMALQMKDDQASTKDEDSAGPQGPKGPTGPDGRISEGNN